MYPKKILEMIPAKNIFYFLFIFVKMQEALRMLLKVKNVFSINAFNYFKCTSKQTLKKTQDNYELSSCQHEFKHEQNQLEQYKI